MLDTAKNFAKDQPYKIEPYSSRAWGHKFHSLCSYQGKLKPSIAHFIVEHFSKVGDTVLDPLGGVGTVAFEAALLGRSGITNDISPFASAVATAKISPFSSERIIKKLESYRVDCESYEPTSDELKSAEFGLNGKVRDYYHPKTLKQILFFRARFLDNKISYEDSWIRANLLHILHGNRPYALSRTSHPVTPMNPTGEFIYKPVVDFIQNRIRALAKAEIPKSFLPGKSFMGSFQNLPNLLDKNSVDLILTSPPFLGMRFDRPNWLRMWFVGWQAEDFHKKSLDFLDRRQTKTFECYGEFFDICAHALKKGKLLVVHLGGSAEVSMSEKLIEQMPKSFKLLHKFAEDVEQLETFGIKDRGRTKTHEFLFLTRV
jgi:hypothetical protein